MIDKASTRASCSRSARCRGHRGACPAAVAPRRPRRARRQRRQRPRRRQRRRQRAAAAAKQYKIGYSNAFGVGNGFREEQVCTAKAEALVVGPGLRR